MISRSPCEVSRFKYYGYIGQRQELLVTLSGLAKMEGTIVWAREAKQGNVGNTPGARRT